MVRNISTCVELTTITEIIELLGRKHLHMRGANKMNAGLIYKDEETSPHAWS